MSAKNQISYRFWAVPIFDCSDGKKLFKSGTNTESGNRELRSFRANGRNADSEFSSHLRPVLVEQVSVYLAHKNATVTMP